MFFFFSRIYPENGSAKFRWDFKRIGRRGIMKASTVWLGWSGLVYFEDRVFSLEGF